MRLMCLLSLSPTGLSGQAPEGFDGRIYLSTQFPNDRSMTQVWLPRHDQLSIDDLVGQERLFRKTFKIL